MQCFFLPMYLLDMLCLYSYLNIRMTTCDKFQSKALELDLYRRPFLFYLPDRKTMYRSLLGSVLSVITVSIMLSYATYKLVELSSLNSYKINKATQEYFYSSSFTFSEIDGFHVAAAVTSYDGSEQPIEDPEIG